MSKKRYPRLGCGGGNIPRNSACKACGATEGIRPQAVRFGLLCRSCCRS